jgi:hypothetical protein
MQNKMAFIANCIPVWPNPISYIPSHSSQTKTDFINSNPFRSAVDNSKMTSKTHSTVKRTFKLHIQKASVIDPLRPVAT